MDALELVIHNALRETQVAIETMEPAYEQIYQRIEAAEATITIARITGRTALLEFVAAYSPHYTDAYSGKTVAELIADPDCPLRVYDVVAMFDRGTGRFSPGRGAPSYEPFRNDGGELASEELMTLVYAIVGLVVPLQPGRTDTILWREFTVLCQS